MLTRLEQLQSLHADDPTDPDITYMIAMEHAKLDHDSGGGPTAASQVITWLNKTLDLDPDYLYAYFQKAKAQSELGHNEIAKATLQLGIEKAKAVDDAKAVNELSELHLSIEP